MNTKITKKGKSGMQNNQLLTKTPVELKDSFIEWISNLKMV
jgi:hypothetical protein